MFSIQWCNGDTDITSFPFAELDADEARIWDESGDLILVLNQGMHGWIVTRCDESFGQGKDWWLDTEYDSVEDALSDVQDYAVRCI